MGGYGGDDHWIGAWNLGDFAWHRANLAARENVVMARNEIVVARALDADVDDFHRALRFGLGCKSRRPSPLERRIPLRFSRNHPVALQALPSGVASMAFAKILTHMKITSVLVLPMFALLAVHSSPLHAQNAATPNAPAPTVAAPLDEGAALEFGAKAGAQIAERWSKMTPAQRKIETDKMLADFAKTKDLLVRHSLERAGFTKPEMQNAVVEFLREQERNRRAARVAANTLYLALEPRGTAQTRGVIVSAGEMLALIRAFEDATEAERARRAKDIEALDKRIGFRNNPRLEGVLLLNGYIGESAFFAGDAQMMGMSVLGTLAQLDETPIAPTPNP